MSITFDKFEYIEKLKSSGIHNDQARAHAEALDQALKDTVATRADISSLRQEMDLMRRDLKLWTGTVGVLIFTALAAIKFFG